LFLLVFAKQEIASYLSDLSARNPFFLAGEKIPLHNKRKEQECWTVPTDARQGKGPVRF
jgi:hypothetical protein